MLNSERYSEETAKDNMLVVTEKSTGLGGTVNALSDGSGYKVYLSDDSNKDKVITEEQFNSDYVIDDVFSI